VLAGGADWAVEEYRQRYLVLYGDQGSLHWSAVLGMCCLVGFLGRYYCAGIGSLVVPYHGSHAMSRGAKLHEITAQMGHSSAAVTSTDLHANPEESSSRFLAI